MKQVQEEIKMLNKIKYEFYMQLICNHYRVMHFLLGYSKDEIRESKVV